MSAISLLVDSPLMVLMHAMRDVEPETRRQIGRHTKAAAQPIWAESTRGQSQTGLQARLASSAQTSVTARNVFLKAGGTGTIGDTPMSELAYAIEFGAHPDKRYEVRTKTGRTHMRRIGRRFKLPRSRGYVVYPAASEAIPRIASLWVQTAARTIHEAIESV